MITLIGVRGGWGAGQYDDVVKQARESEAEPAHGREDAERPDDEKDIGASARAAANGEDGAHVGDTVATL